MGILRTDKISGLETPTAVTGSVSFDGTDDGLIIADHGDTFDFLKNDFTVECWIYPRGGASSSFGGIWSKGQSYQLWWKEDTERIEVYASSDGSNYNILNAVNSGNGSVPANQWSHIAHTREGDTFRIFVNGALTNSTTSSSTIFANTNAARISDYDPDTGTYELDGEISNLRVLKGTALYTADFTPPTHALEVINDTIILCCNNPDSVTASAFAGIGTAYAITTAGNPTVATRDPGLTRDFTSGTEFRGVTTFDTQGYFVPPSGTTTDRDRTGGRGVIKGGDNAITYISISSQGNTKDFGDLTVQAINTSACASSTRGLFSAGYNHPSYYKIIDFVTIATTGDATSFGEITTSDSYVYGMGGCSSSTRGLFAGGSAPSTSSLDTITYVTIASLGNSQNFGDLTDGVRYPSGTSSPIRGIFGGGRDNSGNKNVMSYITIATTGDATDFGDLTYSPYSQASTGSSTRGMTMGGANPAGSAAYDNIDYFTIATTGNTQDFGNLTVARSGLAATSNAVRGTFAGGNTVPSNVNHIDYVTIASTGDALDFGDLYSSSGSNSACSDSHGGIS